MQGAAQAQQLLIGTYESLGFLLGLAQKCLYLPADPYF